MSDLDRHPTKKIEVYRLPGGRIFLHPDDKLVCEFFHVNRKECPCVFGEFLGNGDLAFNWQAELHPSFWEPDVIVTHHLKAMTVMIPASEIDSLPDWQDRVEPIQYVPSKKV